MSEPWAGGGSDQNPPAEQTEQRAADAEERSQADSLGLVLPPEPGEAPRDEAPRPAEQARFRPPEATDAPPLLPPEPHAGVETPASGSLRGVAGNGSVGGGPESPGRGGVGTDDEPIELGPDDGGPPPFWEAPPREVEPRQRSFGVIVLAWLIAVLLGAGAGATGAFLALENRNEVITAPDGSGIVRVSPPIADPPDQPANAAAAVAEVILPSIVQIDLIGGLGQEGVGSGVIYRSDGYIVTNDHVIRNADEIQVRLSNGDRLPAAVVGTAAPAVDIAVIKVAAEDLPSATFGTTDDLRVGDMAVAIGSPFGLEATVTSGVVSALHRNAIEGGVGVRDAIQTDAAINPGNSGGALANANGEVIGINTAIIGGGGGNVGIGFAIPVEQVRKVADQIIERGSARLAFLGVEGSNIPGREGALIVGVLPDTPAAEAGLRPDDIIIAIDGQRIRSFDALISYLISKDPGDRVTITFVRDGEEQTTDVVLTERREG